MYTATQSRSMHTHTHIAGWYGWRKLQDRIDQIRNPCKPSTYFQASSNRYSVLDIDGRRAFNYVTTYFDTTDFQFYRDHHNRLPSD